MLPCLEKDPGSRPESADALAALLDGLESPWTQDRAHRWWETNHPAIPEGDAPAATAILLETRPIR